MSGGRNLNEILQAKIAVFRDLQSILKKVLDHRQGSTWAYEQTEEISGFFARLAKLDKTQKSICDSLGGFSRNAELQDLIAELENLIHDTKRLMTLFRLG